MSNSLEWGTDFGVFGLSSGDSETLERAALVLRPWMGFRGRRKFGQWRIERDLNEMYHLHSPDGLQKVWSQWATPGPFATMEKAVLNLEFQAAAVAVLHPDAPPGFHGALLGQNGRAVGIVGNREAGKSTLSMALWQAGFSHYGDDGFYFDQDGKSARPLPRRSRLRAGSRALFSEADWASLAGRPSSHLDSDGSLLFHGDDLHDAVTLEAIVILSAEPADLRRLEPTDALMKLVVHTYEYPRRGVGPALSRLAPLVNRLPCYAMGRGPLPSRVQHIRSLL